MALYPADTLYPADDLYPDGSPVVAASQAVAPSLEVPHLAWPFRFAGRRLAQVEQDSIEDLQQSVHAYLATPRGDRPLSPNFGAEDPTFGPGVDPVQLAADIEASEDERALVTITVTPLRGGQQDVNVTVELPDSD